MLFGAILAWPAHSRVETHGTTTIQATTIPATTIPSTFPRPSQPRHLAIAHLGISVAIGTLGLQPDGEVEVPRTASSVGWYRFGPEPGQLGAAVLLGHVDSTSGPGIFFSLSRLQRGDSVDVTLASGQIVVFQVTNVETYVKSAFPSSLVYAPTSGRHLNLVTCGGHFNTSTHHYESNVVVFTSYLRLK